MSAPAFETLAELAALPVTAGDVMTPLARAAARFFPDCALLLVSEDGDGRAIVGASDYDGTVMLQPAADLGPAVGGVTTPAGDLPPRWRARSAAAAALPAPLATLTAAARSELVMGLPLGGPPPLGVWLLSRAAQPPGTSYETLLGFCIVACNLLRRVERVGLIEARAWIDAELARLVELQDLLRPDQLGGLAGLEVAVRSRPHRYVGGDYFDVSRLETDSGPGAAEPCALAIADVSGHGPSAAAEAAMIDTIMRTFAGSAEATRRRGPAAVMTYLNRYLFSRRPRPSFATVFLGLWQPAERTLRYASAGHPPPLLRAATDRACWPLDAGDGIPVNVLRDHVWQEHTVHLAPGDLLLLYTDGVTEALAPDDRPFGLAGLRAALRAAAPDADGACADVWAALGRHAGGRPNADDQTVLVVRFD